MNRSPDQAVMSYLTDMLALEEHIEKALKAQINDFEKEYPEIVTQLRTLHATTEVHVASLKAVTDERDGEGRGVRDAIKRVGAMMAGIGAAAVDLFRTEKLPKDLRDDFTALSLAAIGYVMLATTARSLDEPAVAELAERHLKSYADAIMTLHNIIPGAVVRFLQEEGLPARAEVVPTLVRSLEELWRPQHVEAS